MSTRYALAGINVGGPETTTRHDRTSVRVTATAILVRPRGPGTSLEATVVLGDECDGLPGERLEAQDLKALVTRAIDRAIVEVRAAADAFIEALATEPPPETFDAAALKAAYRIGYDRGIYEAGGDPLALEMDSVTYRCAEATDLKSYLGQEAADVALAAFIASQEAGITAAA